MFQGSQNLGKMEFIRLVESNGGLLNGSTRFDFTNYFQVVPSHVLETILWAEADRMRGLQITQENLKNQQEVVKNEVKVNVLNQPYGGFPWIDLPMAANTNWYNAHNFYGDLEHLDARRSRTSAPSSRRSTRPTTPCSSSRAISSRRSAKAWIEKYFGAIPSAKLPPPPDLPSRGRRRKSARDAPTRSRTDPPSASAITSPTATRRSGTRSACSTRCSRRGPDSLLYDELVRKRALTGGVDAGINWGLGNMFDYNGPMLWTAQIFHDSTTSSEQLLAAVDSVSRGCSSEPVDQATLDRALIKMRSSLYASIEQFAGFGRANLLASFALFDDDPGADQPARGRVREGDAGVAAEDRQGVPATDQSHGLRHHPGRARRRGRSGPMTRRSSMRRP